MSDLQQLTFVSLAGKGDRDKIGDYSVTCTKEYEHLDVDFWGKRLHWWLQANSIRFFFGVERGGVLCHLHLQGVVRISISAAQVLTKRIARRSSLYNAQLEQTSCSASEESPGLSTWGR